MLYLPAPAEIREIAFCCFLLVSRAIAIRGSCVLEETADQDSTVRREAVYYSTAPNGRTNDYDRSVGNLCLYR